MAKTSGNPNWQPGQSGNPDGMWKPGQSGNPSGKPKQILAPAYRKKLLEVVPDDVKRDLRNAWKIPESIEFTTYADAVVLGQIMSAARGAPASAKEIGDRSDGRVPYQVGIGGFGGGPLEIANLTLGELLERRDTMDKELAEVLAAMADEVIPK